MDRDSSKTLLLVVFPELGISATLGKEAVLFSGKGALFLGGSNSPFIIDWRVSVVCGVAGVFE